jgi:uncharacterized protein YmfQ (DUF2313 family)
MLRDQFPLFYENSGTMLAIWEVEDSEVTSLRDSLESSLDEVFISTAAETIERWEKMYKLPVRPTVPLEERISTVRAKMRSVGVVNVDLIKRTADAFTNGNVEVTEKPTTYEFEIKFVSVRGVPPNMTDLQNAINQLKPAHLNVTYVYSYTTWNVMDGYNYTWDQLDALNKTWDQIEVI